MACSKVAAKSSARIRSCNFPRTNGSLTADRAKLEKFDGVGALDDDVVNFLVDIVRQLRQG